MQQEIELYNLYFVAVDLSCAEMLESKTFQRILYYRKGL